VQAMSPFKSQMDRTLIGNRQQQHPGLLRVRRM
jgi:hypothetical protein